MSSSSRAADLLLSWEAERQKADPETNEISKESIFTASVLDGEKLWSDKAGDVLGLLAQGATSSDDCMDMWSLSLLRETIAHSSDAVLSTNYQKWCNILTQCLRKSKDGSSLACVYDIISSLLDRVHASLQISRDFSVSHLPSLMHSLLWYTAASPSNQCLTLRVVARCLVYFQSGCSQYRAQLRRWALTGLLSTVTSLSQECSRVLVLLCSHSSQEWTTLVQKTVSALHFALSAAYKPILGKTVTFDLSYFNLPSLPVEEPSCSSLLLQEINVFSRTLCYALFFPPRTSSGSSVASPGIPLQRILGVLVFGLSLQQQQVSAHSTEALLLHSMLPLIHTALWTTLATLIDSCHHHLLPYSTHIQSAIIQGITAAQQNSPSVLLALHKALTSWVHVRRDCEVTFLSVVVRSLVSTFKSSQSTPGTQKVRLSSLRTLLSLVQSSGPILPSTIASLISHLPLGHMAQPTINSDDDGTIALLELLLACVTTSNSALAPPLSQAIHVFSEQCSNNQSSEVKDFCRSALVQCSLLQHPSVVSILPLHHHNITGNEHPHMELSAVATNSTHQHTIEHLQRSVHNIQEAANTELTLSVDKPTQTSHTTNIATSSTCFKPSKSDQHFSQVVTSQQFASNNDVPISAMEESETGSAPVISGDQQSRSQQKPVTAERFQATSSPMAVSGSQLSSISSSSLKSSTNVQPTSVGSRVTSRQDSPSLTAPDKPPEPPTTSSDRQNGSPHHNTSNSPGTLNETSSHKQPQLGDFIQMSTGGGDSSEEDEDVKYFVDAPPDTETSMEH